MQRARPKRGRTRKELQVRKKVMQRTNKKRVLLTLRVLRSSAKA